MYRILRRWVTFALLMLLVGGHFASISLISHAQPAPDSFKRLVSFTAGTHQGIIGWVSGDPTNPIDENWVMSALTEASAIYNPLFGGGLGAQARIFVAMKPGRLSDQPDVIARANRVQDRLLPTTTNTLGPVSREDLCYVEVFERYTDNAQIIKYTIAHELAHCYQGYNMAAAAPSLEVPPAETQWWMEGSAEWLATQVYPAPLEGGMTSYQQFFEEHRGINLIGGDFKYDGVFFWGFLRRRLGAAAAVDILRNIPTDVASYPRYFHENRLDHVLFADWGRYLAQNAVPYQPAPDKLYSLDEIDAAHLGTKTFSVDKYAFSIVRVKLDSLPSDRGLRLVINGINAHGAFVVTDDGSEIGDGGNAYFCGRERIRYLVIGRAGEGRDTPGVRVTIATEQCDPALYEPEPEDLDASETCYLGSWRMIHWPGTQPGLPKPDFGRSMFSIDAEGNFRLVLDELAQKIPPAAIFRIRGVDYQGQASVTHLGAATFLVTATSARQMGQPKMTMETQSGHETEVGTEMLKRLLNQPGGGGVPLHLICRGGETLEYRIMAPGAPTSFYFAR